MGIYDSTIDLGLGPDIGKKLLLAGAVILLILAIAGAVFLASDALKPGALQIRFEKNPAKQGETSKIIVTVTNIGKADAQAVAVSLSAKEKSDFDVYALSTDFTGKIGLISAGTGREITFMANPVKSVLPGTYTFVAKAVINGEEYEKEAVLTVKE